MTAKAPPRPLDDVPETIVAALRGALEARRPAPVSETVGEVISIGTGVAHVAGLFDLTAGELVTFGRGATGYATDLDADGAGVVLLDDTGIAVGDEVRRQGRNVAIAVGKGLLGRVIDPLGQPLDGRGPIRAGRPRPAERRAPAIIDRAPVSVPLATGIKAVDAAIPIGRGQRQLILGDRQTGKTAIAVAAIANQRDTGVISVYCAIGQRATAVRRVIADLEREGSLADTVFVVAGGDATPGLQFIAPYVATAVAEYFMEAGRDVLIVYDDLTRHARVHRELSLLLRRPPGREAYPGDIFYVHARLLERATHLSAEKGGGSLTALPIIETQAQNIAAFIPTNLISITDGQIYLSPGLFQRRQLPAIDIGRSVSRVGGRAQLAAFRAVAGDLKLAYSQFEELEVFARFGTRLDEETRRRLERGRRVREALRQREHERVPVADQIAIFLAAVRGVFDPVPIDRMREAQAAVVAAMRDGLPELCETIAGGAALGEGDEGAMLDAARQALRTAELI